jgi:hypothetical protein
MNINTSNALIPPLISILICILATIAIYPKLNSFIAGKSGIHKLLLFSVFIILGNGIFRILNEVISSYVSGEKLNSDFIGKNLLFNIVLIPVIILALSFVIKVLGRFIFGKSVEGKFNKKNIISIMIGLFVITIALLFYKTKTLNFSNQTETKKILVHSCINSKTKEPFIREVELKFLIGELDVNMQVTALLDGVKTTETARINDTANCKVINKTSKSFLCSMKKITKDQTSQGEWFYDGIDKFIDSSEGFNTLPNGYRYDFSWSHTCVATEEK